MDLAMFDTVAACDKGAEIELRHPVTNTSLGVFITVLGKDSAIFKDHTRTLINARLRQDAFAARKGRDVEARTVEKIEKENLETLAVCTLGWRTVDKDEVSSDTIEVNKVKLPFNGNNALMVYSKYPWIYDQVNEAIGQLENFIKV